MKRMDVSVVPNANVHFPNCVSENLNELFDHDTSLDPCLGPHNVAIQDLEANLFWPYTYDLSLF